MSEGTEGGAPEAAPTDWFAAVEAHNHDEPADESVEQAPAPAKRRDAAGPGASKREAQDNADAIEEAIQRVEELGEEYLDAKVEVKVNGEPRKVSLRELTENYSLKRHILGKQEQMTKQMKELEELNRHAEVIVAATKDPRAMAELFRASGMSEREFALALREAQQLTPEQQVRMRMQREEQRIKAERAQREKAEQEQIRAQEIEKIQHEYTTALKTELQAAVAEGKVVDARHWDDALDVMSRALDNGVELSFKDALEIAFEEDEARYSSLYTRKSDEALVNELGIDRILRIAAAHTSKKGKSQARPKPKRSTKQRQAPEREPEKRVYARDLGPDGWKAILDGVD